MVQSSLNNLKRLWYFPGWLRMTASKHFHPVICPGCKVISLPRVTLLFSLDSSPGDNALMLSFSVTQGNIQLFQIIKGWRHRALAILGTDQSYKGMTKLSNVSYLHGVNRFTNHFYLRHLVFSLLKIMLIEISKPNAKRPVTKMSPHISRCPGSNLVINISTDANLSP